MQCLLDILCCQSFGANSFLDYYEHMEIECPIFLKVFKKNEFFCKDIKFLFTFTKLIEVVVP